jgi:acyl-CoA thioesterase-1
LARFSARFSGASVSATSLSFHCVRFRFFVSVHGLPVPGVRSAGAAAIVGYAGKMTNAASVAPASPAGMASKMLPKILKMLFVTAAVVSLGSPGAASATSAARQSEVAPVLSALGDSTAAGVGARSGSYVDRLLARLVKSGRAFRLVNLAESGATTIDVLHDQVVGVPKGQAGLVVLGVGANDLTENVSSEVFGRRFEAIISGIRARTQAPIVVSNLPDISLATAVWPALRPVLAARVDAYNAVIARLARRYDLPVYDLCAMTRRTLPDHPEYLSADGFHPSDKGYEAWADGLWQVVQRIL